MSHSSAIAIISAKWTASAFVTGSVPGWPRQIGQVRVFGSSPNESAQPQNIFVRVASWTWISSPMTGSYTRSGTWVSPSATARHPLVEGGRALERMCRLEDTVLAERRAGELDADWQARGEATR